MTKAILISPAAMRQTGVLTAPGIPLNAYVADPATEAQTYGSENLVRIYRDMLFIREFETMLDRIKKEGVYQGIAYQHKGPAHLSIGQEAAAVGQPLWPQHLWRPSLQLSFTTAARRGSRQERGIYPAGI